MLLHKAWLGALLFTLTFSVAARAQTTQPTENWSDTVNRLCDALRGTDLSSLDQLLVPGPVIRQYASDTLVATDRLLGSTSGSKLISLHAYLKVPNTLASDLSDDFKSSDVPDGLRRDMVLPDAAAERAANETAARWVAQILQPTGGQTVGVIVLWRREKADSFSTTASNRPVFLLVKGEAVDGHWVFRQITFGDPLEKKR